MEMNSFSMPLILQIHFWLSLDQKQNLKSQNSFSMPLILQIHFWLSLDQKQNLKSHAEANQLPTCCKETECCLWFLRSEWQVFAIEMSVVWSRSSSSICCLGRKAGFFGLPECVLCYGFCGMGWIEGCLGAWRGTLGSLGPSFVFMFLRGLRFQNPFVSIL